MLEIIPEKPAVTLKPEDSQDHKPAPRSRSRSSRSRSYSRSYSRSRSRSSSRSRSRSSHRNNSRSSSHNKSDSENEPKTSSIKRNSLEKEWKEYYSCLKRVQNLDKYISLSNSGDSFSALEKGTGSGRSHDAVASLETIEERADSREPDTKRSNSLRAEWLNSWSECDSDGERVSRSDGSTPAKMQKQDVRSGEVLDKKMSVSTGWNSDSDSENVTTRTAAISEKEEGEASSESDYETLKKTTDASLAYKIAAAAASSSSSLSGRSDVSPEKVVEPEKHKSKKKAKRKHKHKRRSENKTSSHPRKDKAKKSRRKQQKLRETFHWQPPLEFEEEEEDEAKRDRRSPAGAVTDDSGKEVSVKENPPKVEDRSQQRFKESGNKYAKHSEQSSSGANGGAHLQKVKEQETLEDMDICTPEHDVDIIETPFARDLYKNASEVALKSTSESLEPASGEGAVLQSRELPVSSTAAAAVQKDETKRPAVHFKWKPLKGTAALQNTNLPPAAVNNAQLQQSQKPNPHLVRMEIKSTSRVRPGSLFDEVRKTARLNQRPRNQESSSEERSPSVGKTRAASPKTSGSLPRKSRSVSSHESLSRGWSRSSSRSRSRSRSYSYSSR